MAAPLASVSVFLSFCRIHMIYHIHLLMMQTRAQTRSKHQLADPAASPTRHLPHLPPEILTMIGRYLNGATLVSATQVCNRWQANVKQMLWMRGSRAGSGDTLISHSNPVQITAP